MIARFLYRLVSLFFLAGGHRLLADWRRLHGRPVHARLQGLDVLALTVWAFVLGPLLIQSSGEAWRAARDHYYIRQIHY